MIMIGVSTLYKISFVYTHCSSLHFLPSRYLSTVESSLVQLSDDIDFIYKDLTDNLQFSMSKYRLALIQQKEFLVDTFYLHYKLSSYGKRI